MPSIKRENKRKPKGGRAKRANYDTVMIRVPIPIRGEVEKLIEKFHLENAEYMALPIQGRWWEVLGVHPWSKPEEVKVAWKKLALKYHPDVNKRRDAEDRIKAVNLAYENFCKTSFKK
jgi:DnaJ-class molecular chaperone